MTRHYTPDSVAEALARHAPRGMRTVLDPSVGTGTLLGPILRRSGMGRVRVTAIDIDGVAICTARDELGPIADRRSEFVRDDFLTWAAGTGNRRRYDCVVMNPPFAARKERWVTVAAPVLGARGERKHLPLESAFVVTGLSLLKEGGRLLAILPSSVIASDGQERLRRAMLESGAIPYVHELPHRTFEGVESRFYLLVYVKGGTGIAIDLRNHDLTEPESLRVRKSQLSASARFDYGYNRARLLHQKMCALAQYDWHPLSSLVEIVRGAVPSGEERRGTLDTHAFRNGTWYCPVVPRRKRVLCDPRLLQKADVVLKRVGRHCSQSCGRVRRGVGAPVSECLLMLRPRHHGTTLRLLFALRSVLGAQGMAPLVERGCGASYITEQDLRKLMVPWAAHVVFERLFRAYETASRNCSHTRMRCIEKQVGATLLAGLGGRKVSEE